MLHGPLTPAPIPNARLSDALQDLARDETRDRISLGDLMAYLRGRAFGPLMVVFALPNLLPTPPGTSAILGLPLVVLCFQMMIGAQPWFPRFLAARSLARADFARILLPVLPRVAKVEKLLRPRLLAVSTPWGQRLTGLVCLILAVILALPIPLGNMAPAFALTLIGLGLTERDGIWILFGVTCGLGAGFLVYGLAWAAIQSALLLLTSMFG